MKFRTPCFVRIEDANERNELLKWMFDVGYASRFRIDVTYPIVVAGLEKDCVDVAPTNTAYGLAVYGLIDCGNNIRLFKALAAMTDDRDDVNQWYIFAADYYFGEEDVYYHRGHVISGIDMIYVFEDWRSALYYCRKATADEIVEYFKK